MGNCSTKRPTWAPKSERWRRLGGRKAARVPNGQTAPPTPLARRSRRHWSGKRGGSCSRSRLRSTELTTAAMEYATVVDSQSTPLACEHCRGPDIASTASSTPSGAPPESVTASQDRHVSGAHSGQGDARMLKAILVPLDGSALSERAVHYAEALARPTGAKFIFMRAVPTEMDASADALDLNRVLTHRAQDYLAGF